MPTSRVCDVGDRRHDREGGWPVNGSSRGIILVCEECGEKTILDGPLSVWSSNTAFCGCECGKRLTATDRIDRKGPGEVCGVTNAASPFSSPYP